MIMPKISGHEHVLILMDETYVGGRLYLQNRETMNEGTGGGPMVEPPMLKSDFCYLNNTINDKSAGVRKRVCTLF